MAHDAFISYSSKDKPIADAVCATLERNHIRCWIAPRDVLPGANYGGAIVDAISQSRLVILVFSSASNSSSQVMREVERAASKEIPIVPFRIAEVTPTKSMEFFLSAPHWLDAITPPMEAHLKRLAEVAGAIVSAGNIADPEAVELSPKSDESISVLSQTSNHPNNVPHRKKILGTALHRIQAIVALFVTIGALWALATVLPGLFRPSAQPSLPPPKYQDLLGVIAIDDEGIKKVVSRNLGNSFDLFSYENSYVDLLSTWDGSKFDGESFKEAMQVIRNYMGSLELIGVKKGSVFIVLSSGATTAIESKDKANSMEAKRILQAEFSKLGVPKENYEVLTAIDETMLNFTYIVDTDRKNFVTFDVAASNSKVAICTAEGGIKSWCIGPGTKTVTNHSSDVLAVDPEKMLRTKNIYYLSGGIGYVVASWVRPEEFGKSQTNHDFIDISLSDIEAFRRALRNDFSAIFDSRIVQIESGGDEVAVANLNRAKAVFSKDQLDNGSWLLETIFKSPSLDAKTPIRVVRDGQYTVVTSYAKNKAHRTWGLPLNSEQSPKKAQVAAGSNDTNFNQPNSEGTQKKRPRRSR